MRHISLIAVLLFIISPYSEAAEAPQMNVQIHGKQTGFFHVERIGGKWWVIDPSGAVFFIIGTDHVNYNVHWCEALGYALYHKSIAAMYKSEDEWADLAVQRLKAWGFNSLGANNSPSTRHKGLPHMEFLGMGQGFAGEDCITEKTFWTGFPNVFSQRWEQFCDETAKAKCAPIKDDPQILGYFIDNELEWYGKTGSLFSDTFQRPADHTAKIALVKLLKSRYKGDVSAFNKAWGTNASSFDDLLKLTGAPKPATDKAQADVLAYTKLVADRYIGIASAAIRRQDPNHMILGCRFAGRAPDIWDVAGKYCDIVSVNCYRTLDLDKGVMTDGFEQDLATWYRLAKRPLMITEWSYPGLDAGLPSVHGAGQRVATQADRARAFTIFQKVLFATPFIVGSDYFMWVDEPALGISKSFPEDSNYGLVDVNDKPYAPITEAATKLHARVYTIHSGKVPEIEVKPDAKNSGFVAKNTGKAAASCKLSLWVDGKLGESSLTLSPGETYQVKPPVDLLAKPGGHLLVCRAEPDDPVLEPNPANNQATSIAYVPDTSVPSEGRVPVLIANPSDRPVEGALIPVAGLNASSSLRVLGPDESPVRYQIVGDEVVLALERIGPRECETVFASSGEAAQSSPAVTYRETAGGFEVDNGILKLIKSDPMSGAAFDRIEYKGVEVGSFIPLIQQFAAQAYWSRPSKVERVEASNGPAALVLDLTFVNADPAKCRAKYRFIITPGKPYFSSRCLWIENAGASPWRLDSYFHYALSNIAGDASDDQPRPGYWLDEKAGLAYGVAAPKGFHVSYWKDDHGAEHADVYRAPNLNRNLAPGEQFAADDDPAYVIAGKEAAFHQTSADLRRASEIIVQVRKAE